MRAFVPDEPIAADPDLRPVTQGVLRADAKKITNNFSSSLRGHHLLRFDFFTLIYFFFTYEPQLKCNELDNIEEIILKGYLSFSSPSNFSPTPSAKLMTVD